MFLSRFYTLAAACLTLASASEAATTFEVTYPVPEKQPSATPIVYVALRTDSLSPVRTMSSWSNPPFLLSAEDTDRDGKVTLTVTDSSYLGKGGKLPSVALKAQAVVRLTENWPVPGAGFDDLLSTAMDVRYDEDGDQKYEFLADRKVRPFKPRTDGEIRIGSLTSAKLSQFHEQSTEMYYTVHLPENWSPEKKYPVVVYVHAFTGTFLNYRSILQNLGTENLKDVIVLIPDPNCRWGHHVFADSEVNGPWGAALTEELLPYIDKTFGGAGPEHRYLTGVSSGGWSTLWLQTVYPELFAGCWSFAPDPLDFAHFQECNFYQIKSLYKKQDGSPRPLSRPIFADRSIDYKDMAAYERAVGPGGQLKSFGAVFSKRRDDGSPAPWYDEASGELMHETIKQWKKYELSTVIKEQWPAKKDSLTGKIHVYVHENDIFFLDHSVRAFERVCKQIKCDAQFTYMPGFGHHIPSEQLVPMFKHIQQRWEKSPALDRAE